MSEQTFHITSEDVRKLESEESKKHGGNVPKDSDVSAMKSLLSEQGSKSDQIDHVKANLPLPEQPPVASDWNSADGTKVDVGSGRISEDVSTGKGSSSGLREPATAESSVRVDGEEYKTNTAP